MSLIIFLFFLLQLLSPTTEALIKVKKQELDIFTNRCPSQRCSNNEPEIRYPLRLNTSPSFCGSDEHILSCSNNRTILPTFSPTPPLPLFVTNIDYSLGSLIVNLDKSYWSTCLLQNMTSFVSGFDINNLHFIYVNCSKRVNITDDTISSIAGPMSCFSGAAYFVYAVAANAYMDTLPPYCVMVLDGRAMPLDSEQNFDRPDFNFSAALDLFVQKREMIASWSWEWSGWPGWRGVFYDCIRCESSGGTCGFSQARNQTICYKKSQCIRCESGGGRCGFSEARNQTICYKKPRSYAKLIIGTCVGGASAITLLLSITLFIMHKKSSMEEELRLKIENFISTYQNGKPTRYSYSEIKKITVRFKHKLGQGGFGTVYKGALPNGIPVAVKVLEIEKSKGEDFINEVATMGRIHHVNVVRLLGFSSDANMRALIFEFMPNDSLEKLIFVKESNRFHQRLSMEKLQQIAIGIAQGIEYLHQGCDQRILHFDIKPHNILLDHSFIPKISDFGLAKLCSRDQSMITMTAARGTLGYIAPEIYSRNFGNVSYKSDVYSFGMLLMEMVSGRKNVDPSIEDQSAIYFPEWVYEQLSRGQDLDSVLERTGDEVKIAQKLIIVALWCIQWSPKDRPTMSIVVQMLLGEITGLELPPKPFVSSSLENVMPINVV